MFTVDFKNTDNTESDFYVSGRKEIEGITILKVTKYEKNKLSRTSFFEVSEDVNRDK